MLGMRASSLLAAGHSKWAKIAKGKGLADAARGAAFTKLGRQLQAAVRNGGADPASNLALASVLEAARRANMPKDNIARALKGKDGAVLHATTYEAVGPGGVSFLVESLSDSKTRAAGNIRSYFTKVGGELQASGSVGWLFVERGRLDVTVPAGASDAWEASLLDAALEAGAEDVEVPPVEEEEEGEGGREATVWCAKEDVAGVRAALEKAAPPFEVAGSLVLKQPTVRLAVPEASEEAFALLLAKLERDDDVVCVTHNAE